MTRQAPSRVRRLRQILALLVLGFLVAPTAKGLAAELVMFDDPACPWCQAWEREVGGVYAKTPEGRQAPLRRVALQGPRPADLSGLQGLVYTPTFVLLDRGREVGRIVGYPGPDNFWALLAEALARLETPPASQ